MADIPFRFEIRPYDTGKLLPQLSRALEFRTELYSRQRLPLLWRWTDWLRGRNIRPDGAPPARQGFSPCSAWRWGCSC